MSQLFSPDDFRSSGDSGREPKAKRPYNRYAVRPGEETPDEGWVLVSTTQGPIPDVHRVSETLENGSIITMCNQVGRVLQPVRAGQETYLCPKCRAL